MKPLTFLFSLLVLFGLAAPAFAQNVEGRISGQVVDATSQAPVMGATVAVWRSADSTLVTGMVTPEDGRFAIEGLPGGQYYVVVRFIGYETQTISDVTISAAARNVDLGTIRFVSDAQALEEVEVTARREFVEVGIDRTVYNTRDQIISAGGSASEVLENIPSVEVDIDGNLSLRGNQNVAVLINGRPTTMTGEALATFLQGLPADAIERVEVIPNPSAKYEPDGMAGILNIVLREDQELGFNGGASIRAATADNYSASGNVSYQRGRIGLFAQYGLRYGSRDSEGFRYRENRFLDPITYLDQDSFDDSESLSHTLNTSLDYKLSDAHTLSLSARFSRRGGEDTGLNAYSEFDFNRDLTERYDRLSEGDARDLNTDYRLTFRRVLEPSRHELVAELRFEQEWEREDEFYRQTEFATAQARQGTLVEQQREEQREDNRELTLRVDYTRPLGEEGKLEFGYRGSLDDLRESTYSETFDGDDGPWLPDVHRNNTFSFDQQIHAAYGIVAQKFGRLGVQAGLRVEQALTTFDLENDDTAYDNHYFSVFPSAYLTYELGLTRAMRLSYSRRINRPRIWSLNPFDSLDDPLFRRIGNPYLKPEYTDAFEVSYNQFSETTSLSISPYYRRTTDVIRRIETVDASGVTTLTSENFDTADNWGVEVVGTLQLGRWMDAYLSVNGYEIVTDGSNVDADLTNNAFGYSARANSTINLGAGLAAQLSFFYRSPLNTETGRRAARTNADIALRYRFLNDRASLNLRFNDLLGGRDFRVVREDERFYQEYNRTSQSRRIGLTFTYTFGQEDRRNRRDRNGGPDREEGGDDMDYGGN